MTSLSRFTHAPTLTDIEGIADQALSTVPVALLAQVRNLVIRVEDFPDDDVAQEMQLESPFDLLGLYQGVAMPWQRVTQPRVEPDLIFLYRRPILDYWCETGEDLTHVVRHVLIHEIGHHFGFSDEDMEALEAQVG